MRSSGARGTRLPTALAVGAVAAIVAIGGGLIAEGVCAVVGFFVSRSWRDGAQQKIWSPRVTGANAVLSTGVGLISGLVAVALLHLTAPPKIVFSVQRPAFPILVGAVILIAAANAFTEEMIWRYLLQNYLSNVLRLRGWLVGGVQAVSFGVAHVNGLPGGPVGMAGACAFGIVQSTILGRTKAMSSVFISHVVADLIIFSYGIATFIFFNKSGFTYVRS